MRKESSENTQKKTRNNTKKVKPDTNRLEGIYFLCKNQNEAEIP